MDGSEIVRRANRLRAGSQAATVPLHPTPRPAMSIRITVSSALLVALCSCSGSPSNSEVAATDARPADASAASASAQTTAAASSQPAAAANSTANTNPSTQAPVNTANNIYALRTETLDGKPADLASYAGKVTLIVNVASECGYTPQYAGLQKLQAEFAGSGFAVLGFPSNEFGGQEPGGPEQIAQFCSSKYGVQFPMFSKIETKAGAKQSPVYAALNAATGKLPNWNFCKYLVGKDGQPIAFYPSKVAPDSPELRAAIESALK